MTVSTTVNKLAYTGNGVTTLYGFPIPFIAASDLQVYVAGVLKTLTTDYTISGSAPYPAGANVTFVVAPANAAAILIVRTRPYTQTLDLVPNDPLPADTVEQLLGDHTVMLIQQVKEITDRSFTLPITDTSGASTTIPTPVANQLLAWNASATALVNSTGTPGPSGPSYPYAAAVGVDTITATFSPVITLAEGTTVVLKLAGANTITNPTLNANGLGAKTITKKGGSALAVGDLFGNLTYVILSYNLANTRWELLNPPSASSVNAPQGRLCLITLTPVQTADQTGKTVIFYTPYVGNQIPINGVMTTFAEISATLDAGNAANNTIYDLFVINDVGTVRLGYGPAWTSLTARGSGAGTTELQFTNGLWTNKNSLTVRYDSTHTVAGIAVGAATYVGSFYTTAAGQTGVSLNPAAASGGTNNICGLWNAYNKVRQTAKSQDSAGIYAYSTQTWRATNASNSNRITFIDGLQQCPLVATLETPSEATNNAGNLVQAVGVNLDSTSATPLVTCAGGSGVSSYWSLIVPSAHFAPQLGLHYVQAVEIGDTGASLFGNTGQGRQALTLMMEM